MFFLKKNGRRIKVLLSVAALKKFFKGSLKNLNILTSPKKKKKHANTIRFTIN